MTIVEPVHHQTVTITSMTQVYGGMKKFALTPKNLLTMPYWTLKT